MKRALTFLIGTVIAGLALTLATTLYGLTLPREHLVMRRTTLAQSPAQVWRVVTDYAQQPRWHPGVVRAERVAEEAVAPGPLAGAMAGARGAGRALEERSRGDAEVQEAIRGAGDAGPVYEDQRAPQAEGQPAQPVWRFLGEGGESVRVEVQRAQPPRRLVRSFREEAGLYEGSWDLLIETVNGEGPARSQVTLTERAHIPNPLRRAVTRLLTGQDRNAVRYLRGLAQHFGEEPQVRRVPREDARPLD